MVTALLDPFVVYMIPSSFPVIHMSLPEDTAERGLLPLNALLRTVEKSKWQLPSTFFLVEKNIRLALENRVRENFLPLRLQKTKINQKKILIFRLTKTTTRCCVSAILMVPTEDG